MMIQNIKELNKQKVYYIEYESRGDKDKNSSPKDYLDIIRPYLRDMINNRKAHGEWNIKLTIKLTIKIFYRKKKLSICLQVAHGLNVVYLINQKTNGVITEEKTIWKCFVKISKSSDENN